MRKQSITLTRDQVREMTKFLVENGKSHWFVLKNHGACVGVAHKRDGFELEGILYYFAGCNPQTDEDFHETTQAKFGGDDFVEHLEYELLEEFLNSPEEFNGFCVTVSNDKIDCEAVVIKEKKAKKAKAPKTPRVTVRSIVEAAIADGCTNEEVLERVREALPNAKTNKACVNWYRSKLNKG